MSQNMLSEKNENSIGAHSNINSNLNNLNGGVVGDLNNPNNNNNNNNNRLVYINNNISNNAGGLIPNSNLNIVDSSNN